MLFRLWQFSRAQQQNKCKIRKNKKRIVSPPNKKSCGSQIDLAPEDEERVFKKDLYNI